MARTLCNESQQRKHRVQIIFTLEICGICQSPEIVWQSLSHPGFSSRRRLHLPTGLMVPLRLLSPMQLRVHCHGSPGPAADGLSLPEHQPVCGELSEDGAQAARVR